MFTIIGGDGKEYGPASAATISEWIAGGRANLQTRARRAGEQDWKTLGDFVEFNPAATPPLLDAQTVPPATLPAAPAEPEPELADRSVRLGAYLIDYLLGVLAAVPGLVMLGPAFLGMLLEAARGQQPDLSTLDLSGMMTGLLVLLAASFTLFVIQVWMLSTRGQTIGKRMLGIRIVRHPDNRQAGFVHAWLLRNLVPGLIQMLPWIGFAFFLVDSCLIFTEQRRCLHDHIAGTKVVKA